MTTANCKHCGASVEGQRQICDGCKKARQRAYDRERYLANREVTIARVRAYQEQSPEKWLEYARTYHRRNPEKVAQISRRWREANPEKVQASGRRAHRKRTYGLTDAGYQTLLDNQNGLCAICKHPPNSGSLPLRVLSIDHCHETGQVRGLLCSDCNLGLGRFKDSPERLKAAIEYLLRGL